MEVEQVIFNMYKDDTLISKEFKGKIMRKFNISPVGASDIFAKIQNYQIKKIWTKINF